MCLSEPYSKVREDKLLSDKFRIQNELKKGDARICYQESTRKSSRFEIDWDTSAIGLC